MDIEQLAEWILEGGVGLGFGPLSKMKGIRRYILIWGFGLFGVWLVDGACC